MRAIPWQADHQFGVFTTEQATHAGWHPDQLDYAVRTQQLVRLRRGAYALTGDRAGHELERLLIGSRGIAAALRIPAATVSHASAVAIHGLPLLAVPAIPCITLQPPLRTREAALHVHRQPVLEWQFDRDSKVPITSVARSCIDFTREAGLAAGLVAADAALHEGLCTLADLDAVYTASCKGRAGLSSGRQVLELVDGYSESPLETVSRLAMRSLKPAPATQVCLYSPGAQFLARVDFYWPTLGVVGEADGRQKYTGDELWKEKLREERLTEYGLVVVRWGWALARNPHALQAKLDQAFVEPASLEPLASR